MQKLIGIYALDDEIHDLKAILSIYECPGFVSDSFVQGIVVARG
ncbi:hypothetical protein [Microbulbifer sp. ANSA005]